MVHVRKYINRSVCLLWLQSIFYTIACYLCRFNILCYTKCKYGCFTTFLFMLNVFHQKYLASIIWQWSDVGTYSSNCLKWIALVAKCEYHEHYFILRLVCAGDLLCLTQVSSRWFFSENTLFSIKYYHLIYRLGMTVLQGSKESGKHKFLQRS